MKKGRRQWGICQAFHRRRTMPVIGLSALWVTQGRCWLLLGLELEADTGSRHWMRRAPVPEALKWPWGTCCAADCHYGRDTFNCCSVSNLSEMQKWQHLSTQVQKEKRDSDESRWVLSKMLGQSFHWKGQTEPEPRIWLHVLVNDFAPLSRSLYVFDDVLGRTNPESELLCGCWWANETNSDIKEDIAGKKPFTDMKRNRLLVGS